MRRTISGLVAAIAVMPRSGEPALARGGLFQGYGTPCVQSYVPVQLYSGCNGGCGGWAYERLPEPFHEYYYVDTGPTYTGPGNFAPYPTYREGAYHRPHYYGYHGSRMRHHYGHRD